MTTKKRYEYWASEKGIPVRKWTKWFDCENDKELWQMKNKLKNEYKKCK